MTNASSAPPSSGTLPSKGPVVVHVFGRTDVGRTREHNEDAFAVADLTANRATLHPDVRTHISGERGSLFMVADGMGGAAAGEIASAMAVDVILRELERLWIQAPRHDAAAFAQALKRATAAANAEINAFATQHPEYRGMGTTATIAGLLGDTLYLAQVGDSRAYLIREGVARQLTKDQSLMQKLVEAGELTEEEAEQSERRNIILQALGPEATVKVDLTHQVVRRGDVLVLCSDGLSGQVGKDEIARIVSEEHDLVAACKRLVDRANENGGPDNITVIAARFDGDGLDVVGQTDEVGHAIFPVPDTGQHPALPPPLVDVDQPAPDGPPAQLSMGSTSADAAETLPPESFEPFESFTVPDSNTGSGAHASDAPPPASARPVVSDARRTRGMAIAIALLAVLV
ncbi:MAG: Stp1/IreP family PP2C-type Ser/Thr phosphatase, partial [Gemmatimonadota bacterium]|nr:Stp1/IreP family PP2C-type Ser/Thr phosphatase [Gemmatimonadota bacterium]